MVQPTVTKVDPRQLLPSGVAAGVHDVLKEEFGLEDEEVMITSNFVADFGAEDVDARGLAWRLSEKFGIKVDKNELDFDQLGTVAGLQNFLMKNKGVEFIDPPLS